MATLLMDSRATRLISLSNSLRLCERKPKLLQPSQVLVGVPNLDDFVVFEMRIRHPMHALFLPMALSGRLSVSFKPPL